MNGTVLASILATVALAATPGLTCEQLYLPPSDLETGVELVRGVVRGHVTKEPLPGSTRATPGVTVEILEADSAISPGERIDVYPLSVGLDCTPTPREMADVREQYAVGDRVVFTWRPGDTSPSIDIENNRFGYLARLPEFVERDGNGCLDFERFRNSYEPNSHPFSFNVGWRNAHRRWFEDTELLRCYRLLADVEDRNKRLSTFANLGFYHWWYEPGNAKFANRSYSHMLKRQNVGRQDRRTLTKRFRANREAGSRNRRPLAAQPRDTASPRDDQPRPKVNGRKACREHPLDCRKRIEFGFGVSTRVGSRTRNADLQLTISLVKGLAGAQPAPSQLADETNMMHASGKTSKAEHDIPSCDLRSTSRARQCL